MRKHFSLSGVNNRWQYVISHYISIFMVFKHASESFNYLIDCVYLGVCFNSSLSSSHNAPSELNESQFLVVMATSRTAQRNYPRLRDTIL